MLRDRVCIDLRALGPGLRTLANARGKTVAATARAILAAELDHADVAPGSSTYTETGGSSKATVKMTVRLPADVARELSKRARACGASYGDYVRALIEGAPPMQFADRRHVLDRLGASTDLLAAGFADLNHLRRLLHGSDSVSAAAVVASLGTLVEEVREHLALASSVILELKPAAIRGRTTVQRANKDQAIS